MGTALVRTVGSAQLAAAFEHSSTAVVLLDADGAVTFANRAFCRLSGRSQDDLRSRWIQDLTHPADRRATEAARQALLGGGSPHLELAARLVRPDGTTVPVRAQAVAIPDDTGGVACTLVHVHGLTAARRAARRQALPALVRAVALAANAGDSAREVQQIALDQVSALTGWRSGRALAAEDGWREAPGAPAAGCGAAVDRLRARAGALAAPDGVPLVVRLLDGQDVVWWTPGTATEPAPPAAAADGVELVVGVPVVLGDEVVTVLEFLHDDPAEEPDEPLLAALSAVGVQLAHVAERERHRQELLAAVAGRQHDLLDAVLDSLTDGVVACDPEGRLTLVNQSQIERWQLPGERRPPQEWLLDLQLLEPDGVTPMPIERAPLHRALAGEHVRDADVVLGWPGALRLFRCTAQPLVAEDGTNLGAVCTMHDLTDQVAAELSLTVTQRTDRVSGLPNATVLLEALDALPAHLRCTLVQLHVEDLPGTVAGEGTAAGNDLLRTLGRRLSSAVREVDLVTHAGAERFALLLRHDDRTDPRRLTERVLDTVAVHEADAEGTRRLRLSAGLATVDRAAPLQSLSHSELALQLARTAGAGRLEMFEPSMAEQLLARTALRRDLERAIAGNELTLRYQPQFDVPTGRISGVEALVRWQHPTQGLVRPDDFIPLAEETGLIAALGRWVLTTACRQAVHWAAAGLPAVRMSVNVSLHQLDEAFPDDVVAVLAETGLPADLLDLEITETVAVTSDPLVIDALTRLRRHGVRLSIDDFGTGYSVLDRLRSLPFTQLKIDRRFINEITGRGSAPLVRAMLTMAEGLGLDVVAEGVETAEQLAFLGSHGCPTVQGYLLARPLEPEAVAARLAEPAPARAFLDLPASHAYPTATGHPADLHSLLSEVERLTGLESVYLTRVRDGEQHVVCARNTGDLVVSEGGRWPWETSLCATALRGGATALSDVALRHGDNPHVRELGLASYLGVPITGADGALLGTLCAASTSRIEVSDETLAVVQVYANQAALQLPEAGGPEQRAVERTHTELTRRAAFLADAEHAVRQPLTALAGWADLLEDTGGGRTPQLQREAAGHVTASVRAVVRHLDRLLDEARTGVLRTSLAPRPLSLADELTALLAARPEAATGRVLLEPGEAVTVVADRTGLRKIVHDVLDNAAQYSPQDSPVRISWRRAHAAVELTFVDQGIGLAADLDPFAPFTRGDQPEVQAVPGAGLSLHVCRSLAEAMGGVLLGRRNRDRGSTFVLWLPAT